MKEMQENARVLKLHQWKLKREKAKLAKVSS
jgi:hypothetical protein